MDALLLPENAILLHIGPYKTGSTALQSALFAQRDALAAHGVAYPGRWRRLYVPGHAVLRWAPRGRPVPPVEHWDRFAARVRRLADVRVAVSTEDFGRIQNLERSRQIVNDLGADRVHVVAVARAYHRLLPSHWQERVKSLSGLGYEQFLRQVLDETSPDRAFHTSHNVAHMTSMWLPFVPPERFTLVVSDDSDRRLLPRTVEQMLGLPAELLSLDEESSASDNTSLSYESTEMLRRVNQLFVERGWTDEAYRRYLRDGLTAGLQRAARSPLEMSAPPMPAWALDRVRQLSEQRMAAIRTSGVKVVGDVEALLPPDDIVGVPEIPRPAVVSTSSVVAAVEGVVVAVLRRQEQLDARRQSTTPPSRPEAAQGRGRDPLRAIVKRHGARLFRSVR